MTARTLRFSTKQEPAEPGELKGGVLSVQLKFIRLIGAGGMGEVWEAASDDLPGQRFAVKVVALAHAKDPSTVSRFFGEARAAGAIDDPNIVLVHGTGRTDDKRPALVMPYIEGQSLADLCDERGPLPLDMVGKIILQLASALRAAHEAGIIHRDIKPQNVMVMARRWGREWFVILVDFGICKFHDGELAGENLTRTKQYLGTPGYSAPEQILGKPVSAKADIYALGVLAYRILCGRTPYIGDSNMELMNQQLNDDPIIEPRVVRRDVPREWNDLICLCLERDPARRPTASEVGRWFAAGMQNGASMLASLAPRIAAETRSSPGAATISSDVPTALAQIQSLTRKRHSRSARVPSLAAAFVVGIASASIAFKLAGARQEPAAQVEAPPIGVVKNEPAPHRPDDQARQPPPQAAPPVAAAPTAPTGAAAPASDHGEASRSLAATAMTNPAASPSPSPASRTALTGDAPAAHEHASSGSSDSARLAPDAALDAQRTRAPTTGKVQDAPRSSRATGSLDLRAKTWADCFLSDGATEVFLGTAPQTATVPVGKHRIRCENKDQHKNETVTVTIDATKTAVLEKNW